MGKLESQLKTSMAEPARILQLVGKPKFLLGSWRNVDM